MMTLPGSIGLAPRAQDYYVRTFKQKYEAFLRRVRRTPLAILVWGPEKSARDLYQACEQICNELRRRGHSAILIQESKDTDIRAPIRKGIEFLRAENADVIVVVQASYGVIGELHDFAERRIVNSKMLVFVDQAAFDGFSYRGAIAELKALYDNVETFRNPEDLVQETVVKQVLEKVNVLQLLKFRALASAHSWGLTPEEE